MEQCDEIRSGFVTAGHAGLDRAIECLAKRRIVLANSLDRVSDAALHGHARPLRGAARFARAAAQSEGALQLGLEGLLLVAQPLDAPAIGVLVGFVHLLRELTQSIAIGALRVFVEERAGVAVI